MELKSDLFTMMAYPVPFMKPPLWKYYIEQV